MKLKELLNDVNEEIQSDKIKKAKKAVKENIIQIDELKKALLKAESNLEKLLDSEVEDVENDVW